MSGRPSCIRGFAAAALAVGICLLAVSPGWSDVDKPTKFSNRNGIINTRHNMTQSTMSTPASSAIMDPYRNNYGEVCVYCHTPHGANTTVQAPLWNRTRSSATYTTYDQLGTTTLVGTMSAPGPNSLTCLSCHDGTLGVDSIINMPGSGGYNANQANTQNNTFLNDSWNNSTVDATVHIGLNTTPAQGCLACHSAGAGFVGAGATDFTVFAIGTDLKNDHPIGITYGEGPNLRATTGTKGDVKFFDDDSSGRPDSNEIRVYDSGSGYKVECASCHDPHGVPSAGSGSQIIRSFLRKDNDDSNLCQACHVI